jgi:hypothetical protein
VPKFEGNSGDFITPQDLIKARVEAKLIELGLIVAQAMDDDHLSSEKGKSSISPQAMSLH